MKTRPEEKKLLPPEAQKFDRDKSDGIDSFELREILREDNDISENEVEEVFNKSDVNEDGTIDFQECKQMVQKREFKYLFSYYLNLYIKHIVPRHRRAVDEVQVDGHYENQYSCWPPPLIMLLITALELTLFIVNPNNLTINYLIYDPHNRHQLWRYITYMFVHIGYTHLGTNLLIQLILAIPLEMVHKWRVLPLYLAGVLAGSLANALVDPTVSLAGASGGVYALITAHIGTIIMLSGILGTYIISISTVLGSTIFIADHGMSKMVELTTKPPYCVIQMDRGKIRDKLLYSDPRRMRQISDDALEKLEEVCKQKKIASAHQGGFLYPGTKWCGPGDAAANYSDLGFHMKEDMCCREHDRCPNTLASGECRQGICNKSPYTKSHCDCDAAFRSCLQNVNSETANTIGAIFFNIIQVICFKERTPCSQWQRSNFNVSINTLNALFAQTSPCGITLENSGKYIGTKVTQINYFQKKAKFFNRFLRKVGLL